MSIQAVAWALDQDIPNAGQKLVLIVICNHVDKDTWQWDLPIGKIKKEASMSESSVKRHVKKLCETGLLVVETNHGENGRQNWNTYRIVTRPEEQAVMAALFRGTSREPGRGEGFNLTPRDVVQNPVDNSVDNRGEGSNVERGEGSNGDPPEGFNAEPPLPSKNNNMTIGADARAARPPVEKSGGDVKIRRGTDAWDAWMAFASKTNRRARDQMRNEQYLIAPSLYPPETKP